MLRLFVVAGLLLIMYLLVRSAIRQWGRPPGELSDPRQMVQDPMCRIFVPRGTAVSARIGGHTYYFCSSDCATKFERRLSD